MTVRIFLAGEGSNELGGWSGHPAWNKDAEPGVLEALLRRVRPDGWIVGGAVKWSRIRKYRVGGAVPHQDTRNVRAAALDASEAGCEVLCFARDRDRDLRRESAIEEGIALVRASHDGPAVIGKVAIPLLEGWILALQSRRGTEQMSPSRACDELVAEGIALKDGRAMARVVEHAVLPDVPDDAVSLRAWIVSAEAVLLTLGAE